MVRKMNKQKIQIVSTIFLIFLFSGCIDQIQNKSGKAINVGQMVNPDEGSSIGMVNGQFIDKEGKTSDLLTIGEDIAPNRIIIKFNSNLKIIDNAAANAKVQSIVSTSKVIKAKSRIQSTKLFDDAVFDKSKNPELDSEYVITVPSEEIFNYLTELNKNNNIQYAQPDYAYSLSTIPNDPNYNLQWGVNNKILAQQAWEVTSGDSVVKIAVLDSGFDLAHIDLSGKFLTSEGYDFVYEDADPSYLNPSDDCTNFRFHGTAVSGIISSNTNNANGIAGVCWNCKIIPIKVCGYSGCLCYTSNVIQGIQKAIDRNANVLSMSFERDDDGNDLAFHNKIIQAYNSGIFLVASAGNYNSNTEIYPAGWSEVFAVGSTDSNDIKASSSNYGSWVDAMAPGFNIYTTSVPNTYGSFSGTSMAAPFVSGLVGLLKSRFPTASNYQIKSFLISGEDNIDSLNPLIDPLLLPGRINAFKSIKNACGTVGFGPCCRDTACNLGETYGTCPKDCCEFDCTAVNDNTCHFGCSGNNGCSTYSSCDGRLKGSTLCYDTNTQITCCGTLRNCGCTITGVPNTCYNNICLGGSPIHSPIQKEIYPCVDGGGSSPFMSAALKNTYVPAVMEESCSPLVTPIYKAPMCPGGGCDCYGIFG